MGDEDPGGTPPERTFTQADLDRLLAREKTQGAAAEARRITELLGGMKPEDAAAKIQAAAAAEAAALTEAERRQREADAAKAKADETLARAQQLARDAVAERELLRGGFQVPAGDPAAAAEALTYGVRLLSGVPVDADAKTIAAEVESLKSRLPGLFTAPAGGGEVVPQPFGGLLGGRVPSTDAPPPRNPSTPEAPWGQAGLQKAIERGLVPPATG